MLSLDWKDPMKTFFKVTGVLAFNLEATWQIKERAVQA